MASRRRSSLQISLFLIGTAALSGCGPDTRPPMRRDVYASLEDCKADWEREKNCEPAPAPAGSSGSAVHYYYGPRYLWDRPAPPAADASPGRTGTDPSRSGSRALASIPVERGGFGGLSLFHSSGG